MGDVPHHPPDDENLRQIMIGKRYQLSDDQMMGDGYLSLWNPPGIGRFIIRPRKICVDSESETGLWKLQTLSNIYGNGLEIPFLEALFAQVIEHFQIIDFSRSWAVGDFRHPEGGKVPSPWTRQDFIDSRFVRFRSRSDSTEIFMKKIFKNNKVRAFSQSSLFWRKNVTF